jgi:hypothetical protein
LFVFNKYQVKMNLYRQESFHLSPNIEAKLDKLQVTLMKKNSKWNKK